LVDDQPLTAGNARVKDARKLSRRSVRAERRLFLADGPKAVEGARSAGCVDAIFATRAAAGQYADLLGAAVTLVDERALAALSDSVTPAGVVAVCRFLPEPPPIGSGDRLVALAADVRDPGNAGTLIRTADAVGADSVWLTGESVDRYNPKTIRASVGSLFHLPVGVEPDPAEAVEAARAAGLTVLATAGDGDVDLFEADELLAGPTAWLFGNEAHGLPPELAARADHRVRIPMRGAAESLNLSTAAAVCLFASARAQRTI
jgi:TrmH family RNA methyltransferase